MLKTQDLGYVHTQRSADERRAAKLRESLHMLEAGPRNKHTIFFDSEKEAQRCVAGVFALTLFRVCCVFVSVCVPVFVFEFEVCRVVTVPLSRI